MEQSKKMIIAVLLLSLLMPLGCSSETKEGNAPVELVISAAASLTDVLNELGPMYSQAVPGVILIFTYGSSGAMQGQIEEGAPADLFISAASKPMDQLEEKGLLLEGSKKDLLINEVVMIAPKASTKALSSFADGAGDQVSKIALGEPEGVPVGAYAKEVFESLGCWERVATKVVYGSDVRQVLTWVASGEVDCGVVYATDAAVTADVVIVAQAPEGSHQPVIYPGAVIKASAHPEEAQAFLDYLSGEEATAVFEKYGFVLK